MRRSLWRSMAAASILASRVFAQTTQARPIAVNSNGGVVLKGTLYSPTGTGPGIVFFHMCDGEGREGWDGLARQLSASGFYILTVNYRGIGGSGGARMPRDLELPAALRYWEASWSVDADAALTTLLGVPGVDRERIGVAGASCGVTMSLIAARRHPGLIKSVVLLSGPYSERARQFVASSPETPIFAVASREDSLGAQWMSAIAKSSKNHESKSLFYTGAGHGLEMLTRQPALPRLIVEWFQKTLPRTR